MKKFIIGLFSLLIIAGTLNAQDGKKALKNGIKSLEKFASSLDKPELLAEGVASLEQAFMDSEVSNDPESYLKKAEAFNVIAEAEIKQKLLNESYEIAAEDASMQAFDAYKKVLNMSDDKGDVKDALKGMEVCENNLNNSGIVFFDAKNYGGAFDYYHAAIEAHRILKENGKDSRLDDEMIKNEHYFITAASGYYGEKADAAKPIFVELYNAESDKALVYEALYNISTSEEDPKAIEYLTKGREMFPDDTGLLFAEINYYLKEGRLEELINKLEMAKEKEPDNVSIVVTLGNVYDQLSQKALASGETEKSNEYFDQAFKYYSEGLEMDPNNFDAAYSQGALYYNKAASMTESINALSDDYSKEGIKKYNELKAEMDGYFDQALPYFENAEKINSTEANVLIALKEIYARKNMFDKADMYKKKLEEVTGQ